MFALRVRVHAFALPKTRAQMIQRNEDNRDKVAKISERTRVEGRIAELRYAAQMRALEQIPLSTEDEAELLRLEEKLGELKQKKAVRR